VIRLDKGTIPLSRIGIWKYGLFRKLSSASLIDNHTTAVEIMPQLLEPIRASYRASAHTGAAGSQHEPLLKFQPLLLSYVLGTLAQQFVSLVEIEVFVASLPYIPVISPSSSTSIPNAREAFGSPGISIIAPEITTRNPAPAESATSVTCNFHPRGAPNRLGSSLSEYWVFAMQMGSSP